MIINHDIEFLSGSETSSIMKIFYIFTFHFLLMVIRYWYPLSLSQIPELDGKVWMALEERVAELWHIGLELLKNPLLTQASINSKLQAGIRNLIGHHWDRIWNHHIHICKVKFGSVVRSLAAHRTWEALKTTDAQFLVPKFLI